MAYKILGLVDCFNEPELGLMTRHRSVASTTFLSRYAFIDFPLSNFLNSNIPSIGVLCRNHIRSLQKHVGNGRYWIGNTKIGDFSILYDEPNVANPGYNTDVACLLENHWYLKQIHPDYVIIAEPHFVFEADYDLLLKEHIASGARISMLYTKADHLKTSFINDRKIYLSPANKILRMEKNKLNEDEGNIAVGSLIMDYPMLESLLDYASSTSSFFGLMDTLNYVSSSVLIRPVLLNSYVRSIDSLPHYLKYSLELLDEDVFHSLFKEDWTIRTRTYDTPPTCYRDGAIVENAYIGNGSIIEGTVINSVLGRGVKVEKGAIIRNACIGSGSLIAANTHIENAVVDREAQVVHISEVKGSMDDPIYIARGDII